jgi:hypothetical protein
MEINMPLSKKESALAEEILRLRDLAAVCYAGLCAELDLPEKWADVFLAASNGESFDTDGLLPFTSGLVPSLPILVLLERWKLRAEKDASKVKEADVRGDELAGHRYESMQDRTLWQIQELQKAMGIEEPRDELAI